MGRGLVIITTAMVFIFGIVQVSIVNRHNVETGINIDYATWMQARNVAASGADVAMMELRREPTWRPVNDTLIFHIESVNAKVVLVEPAIDTTLAANQIRVLSESTMGQRTARVNAVMQRGGNMPTIDAAIGIYTDDANFTANGNKFIIDGSDYPNENEEYMKYGIATGTSDVFDDVTGSLSTQQEDNITGLGGSPSIAEVDNINDELIELAAFYAEYAQYPTNPDILPGVYFEDSYKMAGTDSLGSREHLQVTYVEERKTLELAGGTKGGGILVLGQDAQLILSGGGKEPFNFHGLVIVLGSATIQGTMSISGALMFGGETQTEFQVDTNVIIQGDVNVSYNSEVLTELNQKLNDTNFDFETSYRLVSYYE